MLRLSKLTDPRGIRIRTEGQIVMETLAELEGLLGDLGRDGGDWVLDLQGVTFVDRRGISLLRRFERSGARLEGASPFVAALLADAGGDDAPPVQSLPPGP